VLHEEEMDDGVTNVTAPGHDVLERMKDHRDKWERIIGLLSLS
jgi:hypothetical protein